MRRREVHLDPKHALAFGPAQAARPAVQHGGSVSSKSALGNIPTMAPMQPSFTATPNILKMAAAAHLDQRLGVPQGSLDAVLGLKPGASRRLTADQADDLLESSTENHIRAGQTMRKAALGLQQPAPTQSSEESMRKIQQDHDRSMESAMLTLGVVNADLKARGKNAVPLETTMRVPGDPPPSASTDAPPAGGAGASGESRAGAPPPPGGGSGVSREGAAEASSGPSRGAKTSARKTDKKKTDEEINTSRVSMGQGMAALGRAVFQDPGPPEIGRKTVDNTMAFNVARYPWETTREGGQSSNATPKGSVQAETFAGPMAVDSAIAAPNPNTPAHTRLEDDIAQKLAIESIEPEQPAITDVGKRVELHQEERGGKAPQGELRQFGDVVRITQRRGLVAGIRKGMLAGPGGMGNMQLRESFVREALFQAMYRFSQMDPTAQVQSSFAGIAQRVKPGLGGRELLHALQNGTGKKSSFALAARTITARLNKILQKTPALTDEAIKREVASTLRNLQPKKAVGKRKRADGDDDDVEEIDADAPAPKRTKNGPGESLERAGQFVAGLTDMLVGGPARTVAGVTGLAVRKAREQDL